MAMSAIAREKTIIALQTRDLIESLNTALRVRKGTVAIDYSDGRVPRLTLKMPHTEALTWATLDTRKRICRTHLLGQADLQALGEDITERMAQQEAGLILVSIQVPNKKRQARLQLRFSGLSQMALTLMSCDRGSIREHDLFFIPKALE